MIARGQTVFAVDADVGQGGLYGDGARGNEQDGRIQRFDEESLRRQVFQRRCRAELKKVAVVCTPVFEFLVRPAPRAATELIERDAAPTQSLMTRSQRVFDADAHHDALALLQTTYFAERHFVGKADHSV